MKRMKWLPAAFATAMVAASCGGADGRADGGEQDPIAQARSAMDETTARFGVRDEAVFRGSLDVTSEDSAKLAVADEGDPAAETFVAYFAPTVLIGSPGQKLTLEVANIGGSYHTFTVPDLDIDVKLQPARILGTEQGEIQTVELTFPTDGQPIVFRCLPHQNTGMVGALIAPLDG
jgi:plastocyanin